MRAGALPRSAAAGAIRKSGDLQRRERAKCRHARRGTPLVAQPPVRRDEGGCRTRSDGSHAKRPGVFRDSDRPRLLTGGTNSLSQPPDYASRAPQAPAERWPGVIGVELRRSRSAVCGFATGKREWTAAPRIALIGTLTGRMG